MMDTESNKVAVVVVVFMTLANDTRAARPPRKIESDGEKGLD